MASPENTTAYKGVVLNAIQSGPITERAALPKIFITAAHDPNAGGTDPSLGYDYS